MMKVCDPMIRPGLCSVTLANLSPQEILQIAGAAGLQGIEWWGGNHVPPGDVVAARAIGDRTREVGLAVSSYGSYYRVGVSETEGLPFVRVLDTTLALGAPAIRVWAGNQNGTGADPKHVQAVIDDTMRIADLAAARKVAITFEYHGGTLTDRNETAVRFAAQVPHPNVFFSWQAPHGYSLEHCLEGLQALLPRLGTLHVYHWTIGSYERNIFDETDHPLVYPDDFHRHPLEDGILRWQAYFDTVRTTSRDHWALLEFVKGDAPEQLVDDARVLIGLLKENSTTNH